MKEQFFLKDYFTKKAWIVMEYAYRESELMTTDGMYFNRIYTLSGKGYNKDDLKYVSEDGMHVITTFLPADFLPEYFYDEVIQTLKKLKKPITLTILKSICSNSFKEYQKRELEEE